MKQARGQPARLDVALDDTRRDREELLFGSEKRFFGLGASED